MLDIDRKKQTMKILDMLRNQGMPEDNDNTKSKVMGFDSDEDSEEEVKPDGSVNAGVDLFNLTPEQKRRLKKAKNPGENEDATSAGSTNPQFR